MGQAGEPIARREDVTLRVLEQNLSPPHSARRILPLTSPVRDAHGSIAGRVRAGAGRRFWVEPEVECPEANRGHGGSCRGALSLRGSANRERQCSWGALTSHGVHRRRRLSGCHNPIALGGTMSHLYFCGSTRTGTTSRPRRTQAAKRLRRNRKLPSCPDGGVGSSLAYSGCISLPV
jgi:hypothetical protein